MTWEAIAAFGSVASAIILLIGAVAAVIQLRHLRLANQLECYLGLMNELNSHDLVEARRFVESTDFADPERLEAVISPQLDDRVRRIATHFQAVSRLLNLGVLDETMFAAHVVATAQIWKALCPVYAELRKRTHTPLLVDVEYLVYRTARDKRILNSARMYAKEFREQMGLDLLLERNQAAARRLTR